MIQVAAVQMVSEDGEVDKNLQTAERLLERAAADGARLAVLPELFGSGYDLSFDVWCAAEPEEGGPTLAWMRATAKRLGIVVGGTWLQAAGDDLLNTFSWVGADGDVLLQFGKRWLAPFETFFFQAAEARPRVVDVPGIGKVGCAICLEGATAAALAPMRETADLAFLAVPSSLARPPFLSSSRRRQFIEQTRRWAGLAARYVGAPVVLANKCGGATRVTPFHSKRVPMMGYSTIADGHGEVLGQAGATEPRALVGEVAPGGAARHGSRTDSTLVVPLPLPTRVTMKVVSAIGRIAYRLTRRGRAQRLPA